MASLIQNPLSQQDCEFNATADSVNSIASHMRYLQRRWHKLEAMSGGRDDLTANQRVEYDIIGALFSDMRVITDVLGQEA